MYGREKHTINKETSVLLHCSTPYTRMAVRMYVTWERHVVNNESVYSTLYMLWCSCSEGPALNSFLFLTSRTKMNTVEHALHIAQTFLHMVQVAVGYLLMLVVMTYNLWIFFAVILGAGLGYLVFGRLRMVHAKVSDDHCN